MVNGNSTPALMSASRAITPAIWEPTCECPPRKKGAQSSTGRDEDEEVEEEEKE